MASTQGASLDELRGVPRWAPGARELADLELLLDGAFAPLRGFLSSADLAAVAEAGELADGTPWPIPVTLTVPAPEADGPELDAAEQRLILTDEEGTPLALLAVEERAEVPEGVRLAGPVTALRPVEHGPFRALRAAPEAVRKGLAERAEPERAVLAVAVREPLHRRTLAQIRHIADDLRADVLVLPLTGGAHPGTLIRAVLAARNELPSGTRIVPVPLAPRPAGPPPAAPISPATADLLARAHIAAAYGATHLLADFPTGETAADLADHHVAAASPLPLVVPGVWGFDTSVEVWRPADRIAADDLRAELTTERLMELLDAGAEIPVWFTPETVARELRAAHPPRYERGLTVFFTGLSGSGKSTVARALGDALTERGRTVTSLDGDVVRRVLSAGLTFSRADRDLNIRRIGYVAAEITRHGGVAVCAPIAPYAATRAEVRAMVEAAGDFVLIHVATPLETCEARDRKGLYAKARAGQIPDFTGISAPYEAPDDADLVLDTTDISADDAVRAVLDLLTHGGWVRDDAH
ncbi:MAG TPA: adenylyl-sulfate kinase [Streptosporangiaceae bacterium]